MRVTPAVARILDRRVPPQSRPLAEAVALLGDPATLHEAAALARLGHVEAAEAADALLDAGLIERDRLAITPRLLSRALYEAIPPARRRSCTGRRHTPRRTRL